MSRLLDIHWLYLLALCQSCPSRCALDLAAKGYTPAKLSTTKLSITNFRKFLGFSDAFTVNFSDITPAGRPLFVLPGVPGGHRAGVPRAVHEFMCLSLADSYPKRRCDLFNGHFPFPANVFPFSAFGPFSILYHVAWLAILVLSVTFPKCPSNSPEVLG